MKQASGSLSLFFFCSLRKKKFLLCEYIYIGMDVALHEKTPQSGYENEEINRSMKIIGEPRCLYCAHRRSRIRILSAHLIPFTRIRSFFLHSSLF